MDVLTASNLEDSLLYDKKLEEISEKDQDKMNQIAYAVIKSYLTQDLKYHVIIYTFTRKIWKKSREQAFD